MGCPPHPQSIPPASPRSSARARAANPGSIPGPGCRSWAGAAAPAMKSPPRHPPAPLSQPWGLSGCKLIGEPRLHRGPRPRRGCGSWAPPPRAAHHPLALTSGGSYGRSDVGWGKGDTWIPGGTDRLVKSPPATGTKDSDAEMSLPMWSGAMRRLLIALVRCDAGATGAFWGPLCPWGQRAPPAGGAGAGEKPSLPPSPPSFPLTGLGCFGSALLAHQPWGTGTNTGVLSCLFKGDPTKSPVTGSPHRPLSPSLASKLSLDTERSSLAGTLGTSRRCHQHRGSSGMSTHGVTHRLAGCSGLYPRGPSGVGVSMADGVRLIPKRGSVGGGIAL